jgi:hypothetical protein
MATQVTLYFSVKGLRDLDTTSKSDPYLMLFEKINGTETLRGRTETIANSLDPNWKTAINVEYRFETQQDFVVRIFDDDGKGRKGDDSLGIVEFPLAHVVSGRGGKCDKPIPFSGTLTIVSQASSNAGNDTLTIRFAGRKLKKMDFIGLSDPYFKLYRIQPNGTNELLYQSAPIQETLDPAWPTCTGFFVRHLAGADLEAKTLLFECWDKDTVSDEAMGQFACSVNDIIRAVGQPEPFVLRHPTKKDSNFGIITVAEATVHHVPGFPEFLAAGMAVSLAASIDWTGSNGNPTNAKSLHYLHPTAMNQYQKAIVGVGNVVLQYDADKFIPAFGFGGKLQNGEVSHCFNLNGLDDPNVFGVEGLLNAYAAALTHVSLSGPTNFAPSIRCAEQAARTNMSGLVYQILLIITDGAITDTDATIDAIVDAADTPLSIIVIGVGDADFTTMSVLDADTPAGLTNSRGKRASRDIIQFVPFREFAAAPIEVLAAEVLREVPKQVEMWAKNAGITPAKVAHARGQMPPPPSVVTAVPAPLSTNTA